MILACRTLDPDTWFEHTAAYDEQAAMRACYACPLITECLNAAMAREVTEGGHGFPSGVPLAADARFGIWGGMLPWQRARFAAADARNRRRVPVPA